MRSICFWIYVIKYENVTVIYHTLKFGENIFKKVWEIKAYFNNWRRLQNKQ